MHSEYYNRLKDSALTFQVCLLMAMTNALDPSITMVHADDPFLLQAERSLPSALATPPTTGNTAADILVPVLETAITTEIVRRTSSTKQLIGSAVAAQLLSCGADATVERTSWLNSLERSQPDIGSSAISAAWFSKFFLDRADQAQSPLRSMLWRAGMVAHSSAITAGYYVLNGEDGGKLDLTSHGSGVLVGIAAYAIGKRAQKRRSDTGMEYN